MAEIPITQKKIADQAARDGNVTTLADFILNYGDWSQLSQWYGDTGYQSENSPEENARLIISHANYFDSWADYEKFKTGLSANPSLQQFEQAADAIAAGNADTLEKLLAT